MDIENSDTTLEGIARKVLRASRSFPADKAGIVARWARGESPKEIARGTGKPLSAIYRILTSFLKAITEQLAYEHSEPGLEQLPIERVLPLGDDASTISISGDTRRARDGGLDRTLQVGQPSSFSAEQILSAMEHLDAAELEKLVPRAISLGAARRAPHLKPKESKLLARANEALPSELKSRLSQLQQKRDARSLTEAEFEELTVLSDRVEQLHAERLEALADLAKLRGTTLTVLMDQLGIRFPDNA